MKFVGAHVSTAGGLPMAVANAAAIGGRALALFTRNQRRWQAKPIGTNEGKAFLAACRTHGLSPSLILAHDSYLINLGHPDGAKLARARTAFLDEMQRCEALGIRLLNLHPGSHLGLISEEECLERIAESISLALSRTSTVTAVLENTAGQGSSVGYCFEHLSRIIRLVDDKKRIGVCFDTAHAFAAGYDLRTPTAFALVLEEFEKKIGTAYLKGAHLNDTRTELGSRIDRHASLSRGRLGIDPFRFIMEDPRFEDIPLILETPDPKRWASEIDLLYSLAEGQLPSPVDRQRSYNGK